MLLDLTPPPPSNHPHVESCGGGGAFRVGSRDAPNEVWVSGVSFQVSGLEARRRVSGLGSRGHTCRRVLGFGFSFGVGFGCRVQFRVSGFERR